MVASSKRMSTIVDIAMPTRAMLEWRESKGAGELLHPSGRNQHENKAFERISIDVT